MKKNLLIKFIFIAIGAFIWMSSSGGRAASQNQGNTGAPGDAAVTCAASSCHGTTIPVNLEITVTDMGGNQVTEYIGDEVYNVEVAVNSTGGNPVAYGFQLVALADSDNVSTESFSNPGSNVQIATASTTGRQYAEHDGSSSSNTFTVQWTAPFAGAGSITFYAAGNGVDGNGSTSGDGGNSTSLSLTEGFADSNNNLLAEEWGLKLYPNPVVSEMTLELDADYDGTYLMTIIDVAGRSVLSRQVNFLGGQTTLSVEDLPKGNYSILLYGEAEAAVINMNKL